MQLDRVMVAVKDGNFDEEAVGVACDLVRPSKGTVYALHVIEVSRGDPVDVDDSVATRTGEEVLQQVEHLVRSRRCQVQAELLQARDVGPAVVQEAIDKEVDLIILGLPYKQKYGDFNEGNAVPYVLRHAPCRVVVWREPMSDFVGSR